MTHACSVTVTVESRTTVSVCVAGDFDAAQVPQFDRRTADLPSDLTVVIVDVSRATIIDSSGLGALLRLRARCIEADVEYGTVLGPPFQWSLMRVTGLVETLGVRDAMGSG